MDVLPAVSVGKETIEQVCADLKIKVGAETIRGYFNEQLAVENLAQLQESINGGLQKSLSGDLRGEKLEIAMDYHDQPYYGKTEQAEGLWVGGQAKPGTTKMYRVATVYVIKNGYRLTLSIKFVLPDETVKEVVEYLMKRLQGLEIEVKCWYLDRGFEGVGLVQYLKEIKQTAIIACPSARHDRRSQSVLCREEKLSPKTRFQKRETRS